MKKLLNQIEHLFETSLWATRFLVILAVISSAAAAAAMFFITTVDTVNLVTHLAHYNDASLTGEARMTLKKETVAHLVGLVDGFLLATVMLLFALGLYELFISKIDPAKASTTSGNILVIHTLDDLKSKLAKVILMILIVNLFESALNMAPANYTDLLMLGGAISLVGAALFLAHKADTKH